MIQCGFQGLWGFPSRYDSLLFTPLYASTRADCLALKIKPPVATVHFPAKPRPWFPAEKAKLQALCLALRRGTRARQQPASPGAESPARREPPSPRSQPRSAAAAAVPQSLSPQEKQGEGRVGRQTAVVEGKTLTRPDNNRRGGEDGGRDQGSAERPPEASGTLRLLGTPRPLLLLAADFLPSSVLIRLTTSLKATRPGSAGSRGRPRNRLQRLETPAARLQSMRALCACPVRRGRRGGRERHAIRGGAERGGCSSGWEGWGRAL